MSALKCLVLSGIRSFGPDASKHEQMIKFSPPLTLIVGQNGCGKTTIIEALRYATTGDLPPGAMKGGAFVHDPKMSHCKEVKGKVQLQFSSVHGEPSVVVRSMSATQKINKIEQKTLEGTVTVKRDGVKKQMSSKCADLNTIIVELLGVSKSILENVIFCHQEDSLWPLSEGKVLKEKFDTIFASSRYVKALDSIKDTRKRLMEETKDLHKDHAHLKEKVERCQRMTVSYEDSKQRLETLKDRLAAIENELSPTEEQLQDVQRRLAAGETERFKLNELRTSHTKTKQHLLTLRKNIDEHVWSLGRDDLKRKFREMDQEFGGAEDNCKRLEERRRGVVEERESLNKERSLLLQQKGQLEGSLAHGEQLMKNHAEKLASLRNVLCRQSDDDLPALKRCLEDKRKQLSVLLENRSKKADDYLEKRMGLNGKISWLQNQINSDERTLAEAERSLKDDENQLKKINEDQRGLQEVSELIKDGERQLAELELELDEGVLMASIDEARTARRSADAELRRLTERLNQMHAESSKRAHLDALESDRKSKQENVDRLVVKLTDDVSRFFSADKTLMESPVKWKSAVESACNEKTGQLNAEKKKASRLQADVNRLTGIVRAKQSQLNNVEAEMKQLAEEVPDQCTTIDEFERKVLVKRGRLRQAINRYASILGFSNVLKRMQASLNDDGPVSCALCQASLSSTARKNECDETIKSKTESVVVRLASLQSEYERALDELEMLVSARPLVAKLEKFQAKRGVQTLRDELRTATNQLNEAQNQLELLQTSIALCDDELAVANQLRPNLHVLEREITQLNSLEASWKRCREELSLDDEVADGSNETMADLSGRQKETQQRVDQLDSQINGDQLKLREHQQAVQRARSQLNDWREKKVRAEQQSQQLVVLEQRVKQTADVIAKTKCAADDNRKQLAGVKTLLEDLDRDQRNCLDEHDGAISQLQSVVNEANVSLSHLSELESTIRQNSFSAGKKQLAECSSNLENTEKAIDDLVERENQLDSELKQLKAGLENKRNFERQLSNRQQAIELEDELAKAEKAMAELEEKLSAGLDGATTNQLVRDERLLRKKVNELHLEKSNASGKCDTLAAQCSQLDNELQYFEGTDEKYRRTVIKLRIAELAIKDCDTYYNAVDHSIMSYHKLKMKEINGLLRDYWTNTYQGVDIDYIEVRSDEDESSKVATSRRNYNYRVVMIRDGVEMDMRGRCSAGQKVLASIIIRLALAETFGHHCGILALDEPTTNLDRENCQALATALNRLVARRRRQHNFQLIIITHDEEFVRMFSDGQFLESFYRVGKSTSGYSEIRSEQLRY